MKNLFVLSSFSFLFLISVLYPQTLFDTKYGGLGDTDILQSMDFGVNGGFILAGHTNSFGNGYEGYLVKTDSLGNLQWSSYYGGVGYQDGFRSVKKTSDGHYIAVGYSDSYITGEYWKLIVSKINSDGVPVWSRLFGSIYSAEGHGIAETADSGYIIAGYVKGIGSYESRGQMYFIKLSKNGTVEWQKVYGTLWDDYLFSIIPTSDGNFVACGNSDFGIYNFSFSITITKITPSGDIIWSRIFERPEGSFGNKDYGWEVKELYDNSIVVAGTINNEHIVLIKVDPDGNTKMIKLIGGIASTEIAYGMDITSDSGMVISGLINQFGNENAFLLKLNKESECEWMRIYPGIQYDVFNKVKAIPGVGYAAGGNTRSITNGYKIFLVKTDLSGNSKCNSYNFNPQVVDYPIQSKNLMLTSYAGSFSSSINYFHSAAQSIVINSCNIVPVELTSFTAEDFNEGINLKWSTATEVNNRGFQIQRSIDKENWEDVFFIEGKGTVVTENNYSYTDSYFKPGICYYRLVQIDYDGTKNYLPKIEIDIKAVDSYLLEQNYPNPFNPVTTIKYAVPEISNIKITVYNLMGEETAVLVNEIKNPGRYEVKFDASSLSSGIYLYKMEGDNFRDIKKLILIK